MAIYGCWIISVTDCIPQSFPEWPYMVVGSSVSREACVKVFQDYRISYGQKTVHSSFTEIMSSERDRGRIASLRHRRELYR